MVNCLWIRFPFGSIIFYLFIFQFWCWLPPFTRGSINNILFAFCSLMLCSSRRRLGRGNLELRRHSGSINRYICVLHFQPNFGDWLISLRVEIEIEPTTCRAYSRTCAPAPWLVSSNHLNKLLSCQSPYYLPFVWTVLDF